MRTNVYVDGFNLYYGAVKGTPYKWLDIRRMCELIFPKNEIAEIHYCTAIVQESFRTPLGTRSRASGSRHSSERSKRLTFRCGEAHLSQRS
jgi:hypothetical protein